MEADQEQILQSPLIRHGQAILSAGLIVIVATFGLENALIRNLMLLIAAVEIIVTPRILRRIAES